MNYIWIEIDKTYLERDRRNISISQQIKHIWNAIDEKYLDRDN